MLKNESLGSELDIRELTAIVFKERVKIFVFTLFFFLVSISYALFLPDMYESEIIVAPAQGNDKSGLSSLAGQYSGLAAIAGISLGGNSDQQINHAIALITSWPFIESLIKNHDLKSKIMAIKKWDSEINKVVYDESVYDDSRAVWVEGEPSSWETFKRFQSSFSVSSDPKTNLISIKVKHQSPLIAFEIVESIKKDINEFFRAQNVAEAKRNIDYLRAKIDETDLSEMESIFYRMIENQTKTLMLAEASEEYLVRTVVPAKIPEQKIEPSRPIIVLMGTILGFSLVILYILSMNLGRMRS